MDDPVTFRKRTGVTATGVEIPLKHEEVYLLGRHIGHLWPGGALALIRIISPADKNLVEVACAQHLNIEDTNATQSSSLIDEGTKPE